MRPGKREDAFFANAPHTLTYTLALANAKQPIPTLASLQSHVQQSVGLQGFSKLQNTLMMVAENLIGTLCGEMTQLMVFGLAEICFLCLSMLLY